eukprot:scaffold17643_cov129-Isochrysis_galbana.AAC.2
MGGPCVANRAAISQRRCWKGRTSGASPPDSAAGYLKIRAELEYHRMEKRRRTLPYLRDGGRL